MTAFHASLSASKSSRWVQCPGSIAYEEFAKKELEVVEKHSPAAEEGTAMHALLEHCLNNGEDPLSFEDVEFEFNDHGKKKTIVFNDEQVERVRYVFDFVSKFDMPISTETRVHYNIGLDAELTFGTCDVMMIDGKHLRIIDAKFGRTFVDQNKNYQMMLYAIGAVDALSVIPMDIETITMHIVQPRADYNSPEGWTVSRETLEDWREMFTQAAKKVIEAKESLEKEFSRPKPDIIAWSDGRLNPSLEACRHCVAAPVCPKEMDEYDAMKALKSTTPVSSIVDLHKVLEDAEMVENFIKEVRAYAQDQLVKGHKIEGLKLLQGRRGARKWSVSDEELKSNLNVEGISLYKKPDLKTPAQLEKELAKKLGSKTEAADYIKPLVSQDEARPKLAFSHEKGVEWLGDVANDFDIVD